MTPQELCNKLKDKLDVELVHIDISYASDREPHYNVWDGEQFILSLVTFNELKEYVRSLNDSR